MTFIKNSVRINGRNFFYWEKNKEQNRVVVLLHGFPGNHKGLLPLARALVGNVRIIVPDLPACGQSDSLPEVHSLENYSHWLAEFLRGLAIDRAIIVGHSFGSRVALTFSVRHPDKVEKLVLLTPVVEVSGVVPKIASLKGVIAKLLPDGLKKAWLSNGLYQIIVHMIVFKSADAKMRREISDMDARELENLDPAATIQIFDEFYGANLTAIAAGNVAPTLVVASALDEIATLQSVTRLAETMGHALLQVIEGAGHLVPLEKPKVVAMIINQFIQQ